MGQTFSSGGNTFAATAWSGAGFGLAAELEMGVAWVKVENDLDQSANNIEKLTILAAAEGIIGGGDAGAFICRADNSTDAMVQNLGRVELNIKGTSGNKVENIHQGGQRGLTRLLGFEFETTSISAGRLSATGDTIIDEFYGLGGKSAIAYGASGGTMDFAYLMGGVHTLQRRADLIIVGEGATLNLDPNAAVDWTAGTDAEILIHGGTVNWYGGELPKITGLGGVIDFRYARQELTAGLGATSFNLVGTKVFENPKVNTSNATTPPAIERVTSGLTAFGGSFVPAPS